MLNKERGYNMKKVWVLEKWATREERIQTLKDVLELCDKVEETVGKEDTDKAREIYRNMLEKVSDPSFEGEWIGWVGKSVYKHFCQDAIESMKFNKNKNYKYRVVSAQIEDDATEWVKYVNPVENEGVLRYLYVKARY